MTNCVKTLQVSLQQDGFCIATGPHDSGIVYPCPTTPFAPVLLKSPVVLHLHCPNVFPDEVLKVHAEHLGHFLALQNVPKINRDFESTLFLSMCKLFTRDTVLSLYENTLTDEALRGNILNIASKEEGGDDSYPSVFVNFHKSKASQILSLLRKLLDLFDLDDLRDSDIVHKHGEEPRHMVFLYLIQLLAIFVSSCMEDKDLATIMSVASAAFLEVNYCDPLCAATLVKPMFIPYYDQQVGGKKGRKGETEAITDSNPEARLKYYRLFTGYELDTKGSDVSIGMDMTIRWTDHSVLQRMQGYKIVESKSKKFWFVAPQMGDRMAMVKNIGLKLMGGQTDTKALKICSYLMSDNIMAYIQCAVFGTMTNMLPCHANSDFTETVMTTIKSSMTKFTEVVRHQSANLMVELSQMTDSCLSTTGVGFAGQEKGNVLYFGKVFTGQEDKRPPPSSQARLGVFTSVTLGMTNNTMMKAMLNIALKAESKINPNSSLNSMLSMPYKPVAVTKVATDAFFYGRYHHRFNTGEFTEVACVKAMNDPRYNNLVHEENLSNSSKYQLTLSHGALPMCTLTLAMTIRQTVMMAMGFLCAELARVIYAPKTTESNLCKHLISLSMAGKFRHGKDEDENTNSFEASYGTLIKLTGPAFGNPGMKGVNYQDLDSMEWLQAHDNRLPDYIHRSLNKIGDTKKEVRKIMQEKNMSYNRVVFIGEMGPMKFATVFANEEYMIHAPMMVMSSMRVFSNNSNNNSYGSVKLCRQGSYYPVKVFSNRCVDTTLYSSQGGGKVNCASENKSTIDEMVARIKRGVSCVLPKIDVNRIKMMTPELNEKEFDLLVSAVKNNNIEVIGQESCSYSSSASCSTSSEGNSHVPHGHWPGVKRPTEELDDGSPEKKKAKAENELTIYDTEVDFGFDDSD